MYYAVYTVWNVPADKAIYAVQLLVRISFSNFIQRILYLDSCSAPNIAQT